MDFPQFFASSPSDCVFNSDSLTALSYLDHLKAQVLVAPEFTKPPFSDFELHPRDSGHRVRVGVEALHQEDGAKERLQPQDGVPPEAGQKRHRQPSGQTRSSRLGPSL